MRDGRRFIETKIRIAIEKKLTEDESRAYSIERKNARARILHRR